MGPHVSPFRAGPPQEPPSGGAAGGILSSRPASVYVYLELKDWRSLKIIVASSRRRPQASKLKKEGSKLNLECTSLWG